MGSRSFRITPLVCIAEILAISAQAQQKTIFHIWRTIPFGADGFWDYLRFDPDANRLFIARSTRVMAVDLATGKVATEISATLGVHGVVLDAGHRRGVTSNGKANNASNFYLDSLKVINRVPTGEKPDGILWEPFTRTVLTMKWGGEQRDDDRRCDCATKGAIALPGRSETGASDGKGRVYVNLEDKAQIAEIDLEARAVKHSWDLAGCASRLGLRLIPRTPGFFSACHNGMLVVVDASSGANVAKVPIGMGVDAAAFDEEIHTIITSNKEGSVSVIEQADADTYHNLQIATTLPGAKTKALDPSRHLVYTVANQPDGSGQVRGVLVVIGP